MAISVSRPLTTMWGGLSSLQARFPAGLSRPEGRLAASIGRPTRLRRGSALLAVLWIAAAMAAIALSLSNTVRGETERTSTVLDDLRSYYLATGAIDRAMLEVLWSAVFADKRMLPKGSTVVEYRFPTGAVHVELIPETARLDLNSASPEVLYRLMLALGIAPARALEIAQATVEWRTPGGGPSDSSYLSVAPSFRAGHASFQETEELLLVKGVTPEIFYGTYVPASALDRETNVVGANGSASRLIHVSGLVDCLSTFGSKDKVDVNTANAAVLAAVGVPPDAVNLIVERRRAAALDDRQLAEMAPLLGPGAAFLRLEGNSILNIRATARVLLPNGQLSDLKRTVAAQVKYMPHGYDSAIHILRWYDTTFSNPSNWSN